MNVVCRILLTLVSVLLSCVSCKSSDNRNSASDANENNPDAIHYDTSQVRMLEFGRVTYSSQHYDWTLFQNTAYACGVSGFYTFMIVSPVVATDFSSSVWVLMPGGGVGYYDSDFIYHGTESMNLERNADAHLAVVQQHLSNDTLVRRRVAEGWRVLIPAACDHDLYSGRGTPYHNNPHRPEDTVDGLLATMAAVDFAARQSGSGYVFLHGTSAGSAGAWSVLQMFMRNGVELNGALLDAYAFSSRLNEVQANRCSELHRNDPAFSIAASGNKVGALMNHPDYYLERVLGSALTAPLFVVIGGLDFYCCGDIDPLTVTTAAGYDNNCRYAYSDIASAIQQLANPHYRFAFVANRGHVLSTRPEAIQLELEDWLQSILVTQPDFPWP